MLSCEETIKVDWPLVIYLFCFMFAPPVLPINFVFVLSAFSFFTLYKYYRRETFVVISKSRIDRFSMCTWLYLAYIVFVICINALFADTKGLEFSNYYTRFYQMLLITPIMMVCIIHIIVYANHIGFNINHLLIHFILAGMIQAILCICAFISPEIRSIFVDLISHSSGTVFSDYILNVRVYGFANGVYDAFGWGTGILAFFPLFLEKSYRKKYLICIPFLLLVPLLNARTGIVMFCIGTLFYIFLWDNNKVWFIIKKFILVILGFISLYVVFQIVKINNASTYEWIMAGIEDIYQQIFESDKDGGLEVLFSDRFWTLPEFPDSIFGTGHDIWVGKRNLYYTHSDVGYVNDLWIGGIIGCLIFYSIIIFFWSKAIKIARDAKQKKFLFLIGITIAVFNVKSLAFTHSPATAIIFTILFYLNYENSKINENC